MALFKNLFISYEIMKFEGDYLVLHCSREDFIKAPFSGNITKGNTTCKLSNEDFDFYISHVNTIIENGKVNAGQLIGKPMIDNKYGQNIAYILVKLKKGNQLEDILKYLKFQDDTIEKPKKVEVVKEIKKEEKSPKTETPKKKSSKKKTTKKK